MNVDLIQIWGDSIGKGVVFDSSRRRYVLSPERCAVRLQQILNVPILNHARMGATIVDGLREFQTNEKKREKVPGSIVAIEYGGNDCDLNWAEISDDPTGKHDAKVPIEIFKEHLTAFVQQVRLIGGKPVLITPPPLDARRYFAWISQKLNPAAILQFLGDVQHIYRWQERYALAIGSIAKKENCEVIDVRDKFLEQKKVADFLCLDGIHPNAKGQALIVAAVTEGARDRRVFRFA